MTAPVQEWESRVAAHLPTYRWSSELGTLYRCATCRDEWPTATLFAAHLRSAVEQQPNARTIAEVTIARVREIRCGNCGNPLSEGSGNCVSDAGRPHIYDEADLRAALDGSSG